MEFEKYEKLSSQFWNLTEEFDTAQSEHDFKLSDLEQRLLATEAEKQEYLSWIQDLEFNFTENQQLLLRKTESESELKSKLEDTAKEME